MKHWVFGLLLLPCMAQAEFRPLKDAIPYIDYSHRSDIATEKRDIEFAVDRLALGVEYEVGRFRLDFSHGRQKICLTTVWCDTMDSTEAGIRRYFRRNQ